VPPGQGGVAGERRGGLGGGEAGAPPTNRQPASAPRPPSSTSPWPPLDLRRRAGGVDATGSATPTSRISGRVDSGWRRKGTSVATFCIPAGTTTTDRGAQVEEELLQCGFLLSPHPPLHSPSFSGAAVARGAGERRRRPPPDPLLSAFPIQVEDGWTEERRLNPRNGDSLHGAHFADPFRGTTGACTVANPFLILQMKRVWGTCWS
jgi:hypothetical protein